MDSLLAKARKIAKDRRHNPLASGMLNTVARVDIRIDAMEKLRELKDEIDACEHCYELIEEDTCGCNNDDYFEEYNLIHQ